MSRSRSSLSLVFALVVGASSATAASLSPAGGGGCEPWVPTFDGLPGVSGRVRAGVVFDDGSGPALYVGGISLGVARWDGSDWSSTGYVGQTLALAVFDDGAGAHLYAGTYLGVSRWDGTSWSQVPGSPTDKVWALAVHDDGSGPALFAGGEFASAGGVPSAGIARFDGASWSSPAGGTNLAVYALGVHDEGAGPRLFAGGAFTSAGGVPVSRIARWDGTSWSALGSGANDEVHALASFDDGSGSKLWVGGTFTIVGGVTAFRSARWNGTSFEALSWAGADVHAFAVHDDGGGATIYAGSSNGSFGFILEWNGASWRQIGGPIAAPVRSLVSFDDGGGADLYVGGDFETAGPVLLRYVARWDGTWLSPLCGGVNEPVGALSTWDDGSGAALYAGGYFDFAGELHVGHVARWDGTQWRALGEGLDVPDAPHLCYVRAMCVYDDGGGPALFVGGNFTRAGGASIANVANNVARWDGTSWSDVGGGLDGPVAALVVHDDGTGPALWAGGDFDLAGGGPAPNLARWDGSGWSAPAGGAPDDAVHALASWDDGGGRDLYVGGLFAQCGSVAASRIARWDGASWSALGSGVTGGSPYLTVETLAVFDDGGGDDLYVGGSFATAGGVAASRIARWDGTGWSALGLGISSGPSDLRQVQALHVFDDGTGPALYVACAAVTGFDSVIAQQVARWSGTSWSALGAGAVYAVYAFADYDDGTGPALFVGSHRDFEDTGDYFLAKWRGCPGGTTFCHGDASDCPCGNGGLPGRGCDNAQGTGGVELALVAQTMSPNGATLQGMGFSTMGTPTAMLIRSNSLDPTGPVVFGDGLRCVNTSPLVSLTAAATAAGGVSTHIFGHDSGPGIYYYQLWYRNNPSSYCTPAAFNLSSGRTLVW